MAKNQAKMQMVDDDEVENVGIMSGFMDDIEELMEEITQQEMAGEGDDADMARILGRSPDSPEVLMNNLRGDYRSIDARREELADRVGYNAAQQTPDEVLAMLQPVFAQQGVAALPMGAADMGPLPMDALTGMPPPGGMPPAGMPPAGMPPAGMPPAAMPMDPAMMGAPPAGMPPMNPAMMAQMPPEGIASLPMDQGAMPPMQMARGGIVQYFQEGGSAEAVADPDSRRRLPPSTTAQQYIEDLLSPMAAQPRVDLMARTRELTPNYQELLGTTDRGATQAQMLFDIAQAALGYASNVGPDGQPLSGSGAARLAGATRALPGQIGARAAAMQDDETRARMAALQQAQSERSSMDERDLAREDARQRLLLEYAKQNVDESARLLTPEELASPEYSRLDPSLPWMIDKYGKPSIAGGRAPAPLVNIGERTLEQQVAERSANLIFDQYDLAKDSVGNIRKLDDTIKLIEEGSVDTGFGAELRQNIRGVQGLFSDDPERIKTLTDTQLLNAALGQDVFGAITALGVGARGLDTPAEREFLREVLAGRITLTKDALLKMARMRRTADERNVAAWNDTLGSGRADAVINAAMGTIPRSPIEIPSAQSAAGLRGATPVPAPAVLSFDTQGNPIQ
jgi:hypothetical protein